MVPPNPHTSKRNEKQTRSTLRDAEKVASNRQNKRFATTSDKHADQIREQALEKARQSKAQAPAPPPPPRPRPAAQRQVSCGYSDSDSGSHQSAEVAPLIIKKKTPPPQPAHKQQRAVNPAELGNTVSIRRAPSQPVVDDRDIHPALRSSGKVFDQADIQPASRTAFRPRDLRHPQPTPRTSSRQVGQSRIHSSLRTTEVLELRTSLHPAFRNLPDTQAQPRRHVSGSTKHPVEREVHSYLGSPRNYAYSPREADVSPLNVSHKLPYATPRRRR